ncbi:MAG TPA: hypothetical protein VNV41_20875 [Candidatus Acidoferrales bacterium]|jgi:hypothetical protein|nr:hypothetical protein [Candidatus Acidoferrales bacterium]
MIPEPQRTYVLELIAALGPAANDFILAGAQAIKFTVTGARGTKDVDFLLNVTALREEPLQLATILGNLGYQPIEGATAVSLMTGIPLSLAEWYQYEVQRQTKLATTNEHFAGNPYLNGIETGASKLARWPRSSSCRFPPSPLRRKTSQCSRSPRK